MPWVRMHGIKDYWDMVRILDDFPKIKQTFNFTPSLLEQIQEYLQDGITDTAYDLSLKNPDSFTEDERFQALKTFFLANPGHEWSSVIRATRNFWGNSVPPGATTR